MEKIKKLEQAFENVLTILYDGETWRKDENLIETPRRIARMYVNEIFKSINTPIDQQLKFTTFKDTGNSNMVTLFDIEVKSTCSHHFLPFVGRCHIGYIPREGQVCGISKLARVVDFFMSKPQIQETLTEEIATYIQKILNPIGVMIIIEARHYCMIMRGVKQFKSKMITSAVRGLFDSNQDGVKDEFLHLLSMSKDQKSI
jgi:GTP cyclohydrolase I